MTWRFGATLPTTTGMVTAVVTLALVESTLVPLSRLSAQQTAVVADTTIGAPCRAAAYRAFDFWLGRWEVRTTDGTIGGHNTITRGNRGCTLNESYSTPGGYAGQSINTYDAGSARWSQTWTDVSGLVLHLYGSSPRPGVMQLQGERTARNGSAALDRITWTRLDDGRVRQFWEGSTDGGTTWTVAFDGYYSRVKP